MKKNIINKQIAKKLNDIKKYDLAHFVNKLSTPTINKGLNITNSNETTDNDLKYINDNYYTFLWEPSKDKPLFFLRKPIFNFLFKYSFRQVRFNDHLRNLLSKMYQMLTQNYESLNRQENAINNINEKYAEINTLISNTDSSLTINDNILNIKISNIQKSIDNLSYDNIWKENKLNAFDEKIEILEDKKSTDAPDRYFSQFGEDRWIANNIDLPKKGIFIDVGAADGITFSNTYYFEKHGWSGLCFEPDPTNYTKAKKCRKKVINNAISNKKGILDFYISSISSDWSGLKPTENFTNIIKIKTLTLVEVIKINKITNIDILSIDTEGTELDVWDSLSSTKVRPKVIIVEFVNQGTVNPEVIPAFESKGYKLIHSTYVNHIFIDGKK